jgi:hypothetical protein
VEVEVGADGPASAPPSGATAAAPPAGAKASIHFDIPTSRLPLAVFEDIQKKYHCIRRKNRIVNVATSTSPWAVQLSSSYDTISTMGGFSQSDLVVFKNTLHQDLFDYVGPDVELVVTPVNSDVAPATQLTCLELPTPDVLTRYGDSRGHIQRRISRILRARAYLDLMAFCRPCPPDYM